MLLLASGKEVAMGSLGFVDGLDELFGRIDFASCLERFFVLASARLAVMAIPQRFGSLLAGALRVCGCVMKECLLDFQQVRVQLCRGGIAQRTIRLAGFKDDSV